MVGIHKSTVLECDKFPVLETFELYVYASTLVSNELLNPDDIEMARCRPYYGVDILTYSLTCYILHVIIILLLCNNSPAMSVLQFKHTLNVNPHLSSDSTSGNFETLTLWHSSEKTWVTDSDDSPTLICKPRKKIQHYPDSSSIFCHGPWIS